MDAFNPINVSSNFGTWDKNESRYTALRNGEPNNHSRRRVIKQAQTFPLPATRKTQPHIRRRFHHGENSFHNTPEITFNHQHNSKFRNQTHQITKINGHAHYSISFRVASTSYGHQSFCSRRVFQSNSSLYSNFPSEYHYNHLHHANITLNDPGGSQTEQARYMANNVNLLMSVIVDQAIIQQAISSVETFDVNRNKCEAWITSVENAAQISGEDVSQIAFSKMIGSPLTSTHRLRDASPNLMWWEPKSGLSK